MSENEQSMLDDAFEETEVVENAENQEEHFEEEVEESPQYITKEDFNSFQSTLMGQLNQLQQNNQQVAPEAKRTPEFDAEALANNPGALVEHFQKISQNTEKRVTQKLETQQWDTKAHKEFPALSSDAKFKDKVVSEMQSLINAGTATQQTPQLLYMATKMAAATYKAKGERVVKKTERNSLPPRSGTRPTAKGKVEDVTKHPDYEYLRLKYSSDEEIQRVIKNASKRTATVGRKGRRVIRF